ncbi:MAG: tetratricopeptide repeat protein [Gammaproteobacteria bacterium]|nr:tetratricopeptide repeat protein [Gammaproteobacteria bacterium]MBV9697394.1 tetratricopeptide repeat protein [Gammaproteobacteria bacterium]
MRSYSVRDVERVLELSPATTRGLIRAGFVQPARGPRREYQFSFQDLIVLRTARALLKAKVPGKRIRRSLETLKRELPEAMPLSGLAISAVGEQVVVRNGSARWQAEDGQYLLGLDVTVQDGVLHVVEHPRPTPAAAPAADADTDWFAHALQLEESDPVAALEAYRKAVQADTRQAAAWTNWGRLLHSQGRMREAAEVYRRGLDHAGADALLLFNHAVLLEDLGDTGAAVTTYQSALEEDPDLADCHYNLARLYETLGKPQHALRHLGQYRRLLSHEHR